MYILEQGMCEVLVMGHGKKKETFVREIGPGAIFGEVALLFDTPRTASIRTKNHCTLATISQDALLQILIYAPDIKNRLKSQTKEYKDYWKEFKIKQISSGI
jgi:CRP-like cAMP-binding protein